MINKLETLEAVKAISDWLPSEEDILFYEEHGWFVTPQVFDPKLLEEGITGAEAFYEGKVDFTSHLINGPANDKKTKKSVYINNEFVSLQKKEIKTIVHNAIISRIAAVLCRSNEIRLFADALMCKLPATSDNKGVFGWHTDRAYWPTCTSHNMITAWMPFQDCSPDMGAMVVVEKSHKWYKDKELLKFYAARNQDMSQLEDFLSSFKPGYTVKQMNIKKGQISFHHCHAIHGSPTNTSNKKRYAIGIHLQDHSNQYQKAYKKDGSRIVIGYDKICRKDVAGNPDYRDPEVFPVLWKG